ncbi:unnamed protein product [Arctogadus glacialis]
MESSRLRISARNKKLEDSPLPPATLDLDSSAEYNETRNHSEVIISCVWRTLLTFYEPMSSAATAKCCIIGAVSGPRHPGFGALGRVRQTALHRRRCRCLSSPDATTARIKPRPAPPQPSRLRLGGGSVGTRRSLPPPPGPLNVPLNVEITLQDVNDNPPIFPNDILDLTIEENVGDGFRVMQLTATDADEVTAGGNGGLSSGGLWSLTPAKGPSALAKGPSSLNKGPSPLAKGPSPIAKAVASAVTRKQSGLTLRESWTPRVLEGTWRGPGGDLLPGLLSPSSRENFPGCDNQPVVLRSHHTVLLSCLSLSCVSS